MADNILKPEVIWIEGRCYRVNDPTSEITSHNEHELYETEMNFANDEDDDDFEEVVVDAISENRFITSFHVPIPYIGSIIGKKGAVKSRIEHETRTEIKIPRQGQSGEVTVLGPSIANVKTASRRINMIIMSRRMKQRPTHFISVPMNNSEIIENFKKFKEEIIKEYKDKGVDESIFMKPLKLHLTVGVMALMDNEERLHASKLLMEARDKVILPLLEGHSRLRVRVRGLSSMNDEPQAAHVVYARVSDHEDGPPGLLQRLFSEIVDHFYKAGFIDWTRNNQTVKMHMTVLNSKYRSPSENDYQTNHNRNRPKVSFDASRILEKYADYDFGVCELSEIHLSQMNTSTSSYYEPTCVVNCYK